MEPRHAMILLTSIVIDPRLQAREKMDSEAIDDYAEAMERGDKFPSVVVFQAVADRKAGRETYTLADGNHRVLGAIKAEGITEIQAEIHEGGWDDAYAFATAANANNSVRRTNRDKRKAVLMMLEHPTYREWAGRKIARHCRVAESFVRKVRKELENASGESTQVRTVRTSEDPSPENTGSAASDAKTSKPSPGTSHTSEDEETEVETVSTLTWDEVVAQVAKQRRARLDLLARIQAERIGQTAHAWILAGGMERVRAALKVAASGELSLIGASWTPGRLNGLLRSRGETVWQDEELGCWATRAPDGLHNLEYGWTEDGKAWWRWGVSGQMEFKSLAVLVDLFWPPAGPPKEAAPPAPGAEPEPEEDDCPWEPGDWAMTLVALESTDGPPARRGASDIVQIAAVGQRIRVKLNDAGSCTRLPLDTEALAPPTGLDAHAMWKLQCEADRRERLMGAAKGDEDDDDAQTDFEDFHAAATGSDNDGDSRPEPEPFQPGDRVKLLVHWTKYPPGTMGKVECKEGSKWSVLINGKGHRSDFWPHELELVEHAIPVDPFTVAEEAAELETRAEPDPGLAKSADHLGSAEEEETLADEALGDEPAWHREIPPPAGTVAPSDRLFVGDRVKLLVDIPPRRDGPPIEAGTTGEVKEIVVKRGTVLVRWDDGVQEEHTPSVLEVLRDDPHAAIREVHSAGVAMLEEQARMAADLGYPQEAAWYRCSAELLQGRMGKLKGAQSRRAG